MGKRRNIFLYPFSLLYRLITDMRNLLYDKGILKSEEFAVPVICVGNITVGGTGKTPHTEYIIRLLQSNFNVAVLSRGYRRKTKGFILAHHGSKVDDTGDELLQISGKFPGIPVAADRDRRNGIRMILKQYPSTEVIIMDDGFQHRKVKPGLSILLSDFNRPLTRDSLLPYGNLREKSSNRKRADIIIVTKTPGETEIRKMDELKDELESRPGQKVFFSRISYFAPEPVFTENISAKPVSEINDPSAASVLLVTGIASPGPLRAYLEARFREVIHLKFTDHHMYSGNDIKKIEALLKKINTENKLIITTEKDAVRFKEISNIGTYLKNFMFYIPVEVEFLKGEKQEFDNTIKKYAGKNKGIGSLPQS
jgi:tetraacyldisaccharide 4'-kinase